MDHKLAPGGRRPASYALGGHASPVPLVNGVVAGIGAVYLITLSVTVTVVAATAAVMLAALDMILNR